MKNRFTYIKQLVFAFVNVVMMLCSYSYAIAQIDTDVTSQTKNLYNNLKKIQNGDSFLFGQEFFNSFRYSSGAAHGDKEYSDSKAVTGAHPAVLGSDFHYYLEKSAGERSFHTEAVKWAYQQGYVITFDWHLSARSTTTYEYNTTSANLVNNIVGDLNGDRAWFYSELDKVISIINNDLVVNGERIPIVFRPLHEMNGGWFWWGSRATTADNYKVFYRLLVDYMRDKTTSVLFCWSPNTPTNFNYFPGNEYVDVLGVDIYDANVISLRTQLAPIVDHAQANGKVAVLSETGNRTNAGANPGDNATTYWKNTILPAIADDPSGKSKKIAWVLTWINASWAPHPYVSHPASSQVAKQSFIDFKNSSSVLFGDEIANMYEEEPAPEIPVAVDEEVKNNTHDYKVYHNASENTLKISLPYANALSEIRVYDITGRLLVNVNTQDHDIILPTEGIMRSGIYVIQVASYKKIISKKFVISSPF